VIQVTDVSKVYPGRGGQVRALDGLTLTVQQGDFVAVRGPSGSGKSTLLLSIGGMNHPSSGQVRVDGVDVYGLSGRDRARFRARNVGFVFQMFHLVPYLSVLENVLLPSGLAQIDEPRERALELLDRFRMSARAHHKPGELSTGERQRTAVARALINRPWLVLADEPTGNLDPETGAQILGYLSEFSQAGGTVVVVTHEPWVEEYATRTVQIREGRLHEAS